MIRFTSMVISAVTLLALAGCAGPSERSKKKDDASNYNMQLGMAYLNQGDLGLAKEKLERAVRENPGDPNVHSAMAMLQDRLGHPDQADKEFKAALNLGPRSPDVLNNYAVYLCRSGRVDEGVKAFEEAAHNALYRTPEAAYTNAGVCLRGAKRDTQAAMSFQRALRIKPNFAEAAYQLADLDFRRGEVQSARETIDQFVSSFEATPDLLLIGVQVARKQGDRVAEEKFSRKLRMDFPSSDQTRALAELNHNSG
ncbi:MAG: type IV pilus biogenesis/stability protein PilW [Proteobacteria bacterium]|nr:type IV pilus biogenesis/stability protein PilW [Pseudomonadota bacterium]